jgi:hypothetical protein
MSSPEGGGAASDGAYELTKEESLQLQIEVAQKYSTEEAALRLLRRMRFPSKLIPTFRSPQNFWGLVFVEFERGVIPDPYRALHAVITEFRNSDLTIEHILGRVRDRSDSSRNPQLRTAHRRRPTCNAIVWAESESDYQTTRAILRDMGLDPWRMWRNTEMASFNLNEEDEFQAYRQITAERPKLIFKMVPADQQDYLLDPITVIGKSGRQFPMRNVPVQFTVAELAHSAARLHPSARSATRAVTSALAGGGGRAPLPVDPSATLLRNEVRDRYTVTIDAVTFGKIRIVLIGANPQWHGGTLHERCELRCDDEARQISEIAKRGHLDLVQVFPQAQEDDLDELEHLQPDIIHVSAHGESGMIILEDDDHRPHPMPADHFADRLAGWQRDIAFDVQGIVLSSCSGEPIGPVLLAEGAARTVVGHQREVADPRALRFTRHLYEALNRTPILSSAALRAAKAVYGPDCGPDGRVKILPPPPEGDS